ncbi:tail fiber domain-containing protein [Enterobacter chuandaensis]|uniref:tail fiber domain-containing protein n=1 Tax=Enterobacter chuandaensis TaxID=2497875 RepID=UPI00321683E3
MSAGTITLTNGSAIVGGSGTSFATELAAGDFIVSTVGGVSYTLPVKTVDSNTQLTLVSNFTGPTQSGAAWSAVPRVALNMVTAALVAQSAEALRGLNYDKQNWQQVYSAAGNITVKLPDGTTFTGPSWKYLSENVVLQSDLGNSATRNVGTSAGTVAAGDDERLNTLDGKSGGQVTSGVSMAFTGSTYSYPVNFEVIAGQEAVQVRGSIANFVDSSSRVILNLESVSQRRAVLYASGGIICQPGLSGGPQLYSTFLNYANGPVDLWVDTSRIGAIQVAATSDKLLKKEIEYLSDRVGAEPSASALKEVLQWNPATFKYKKRGIIPESDTNLGFIANDLVEVSPECVKGKGLEEGYDENNTADAYSLDEIAMIAKLTLSIQELQKQISLLKANGAGS